MKTIGKYIQQKKKKTGSFEKGECMVDDQTIMHLFSRAVREEYGRQGEKNIVPKFMKNGIIFLQINNSIWAQEVWMRRNYFVDMINEKVGSSVVKNIKIAT